MPIFDYQCQSCDGQLFDVITRVDATPATYPACPSCGGQMKKEIAIPARAQFKGQGFHRNDYGAATKG